MADIITLECTECSRRNYTTRKNKKQHTERIVLSRYCPFCRSHKDHKERK